MDFSTREKEAIESASNKAGQYLDSIGQTDLAKLNAVQWVKFWEAYTTEYHRFLGDGEIIADEIPF